MDPDTHKEELSRHSDRYLEELDRIENRVTRITLPLAYAEELYGLRLRIDVVAKEAGGRERGPCTGALRAPSRDIIAM